VDRVEAQFALCNSYFAICNGCGLLALQIAKQELQIEEKTRGAAIARHA
jgi:hypothetical protein